MKVESRHLIEAHGIVLLLQAEGIAIEQYQAKDIIAQGLADHEERLRLADPPAATEPIPGQPGRRPRIGGKGGQTLGLEPHWRGCQCERCQPAATETAPLGDRVKLLDYSAIDGKWYVEHPSGRVLRYSPSDLAPVAEAKPQGAPPCPDCNQTGRHMCEGRRQVVEPPSAAKGAPQKPEGE